MYYYDNYRRILLKEPNRLRFYRVEEIANFNEMKDPTASRYELVKLFEINSSNPNQTGSPDMDVDSKDDKPKIKLIRTSSGRTVRHSSPTSSPEDATISSVDYEDELDLLIVGMRGSAFIYKNSDGTFLREISFGNYWIVDGNNSVILDKNQIILLSSKFFLPTCTVQVFEFDFGEKKHDPIVCGSPDFVQSDRSILREYAYDSDYTP